MLKKDYWIKDLLDEECEKNRIEWKKRSESLTYLFKNDCRIIVEYMDKYKIEFDALFKAQKSKYPIIVDLLLKNEIVGDSFRLPFNFRIKIEIERYKPTGTQTNITNWMFDPRSRSV